MKKYVLKKNDDISQNGAWNVISIDPARAKGCKECNDTGTIRSGFLRNRDCYMCDVSELVAQFMNKEDAKLFIKAVHNR